MRPLIKKLSTLIVFSLCMPCFGHPKKVAILKRFGDCAQIATPIVAAGIASQERGLGHFAIIFAQNQLLTHSCKRIANKTKWDLSMRPNQRDFDGMPSGHTNSSWSAAAYVRQFSSNKALCIPLYATAIVTGISRVAAGAHTIPQVIAGATLAEALTYVNSKLYWSKNYKHFEIGANPKGAFAGFSFRI